MTNELLHNQIALVTGGTAGIGKAIVQKFATSGAEVFFLGTNTERGKQVAEEICATTKRESAHFYPVDVSNKKAVDEAVKSILAKTGRVDILVNNAGITQDQLLMKMTEEEWDKVFNINVKSCYNLCHALVRSMLKAKKGKIINLSSVIALTGNVGQVNYAASKAAIIGFTRALAKELASRNIHVNCIAPGFIKTAMTDTALSQEQQEAVCKAIPLGKIGLPEDVANLALFLASGLSDYIIGQVITVDGGMVIGSSWS